MPLPTARELLADLTEVAEELSKYSSPPSWISAEDLFPDDAPRSLLKRHLLQRAALHGLVCHWEPHPGTHLFRWTPKLTRALQCNHLPNLSGTANHGTETTPPAAQTPRPTALLSDNRTAAIAAALPTAPERTHPRTDPVTPGSTGHRRTRRVARTWDHKEPRPMLDVSPKHDFYLRSAKQAAERLYGECSVPIATTIASLAELRDYCTQLIAAAQGNADALEEPR